MTLEQLAKRVLILEKEVEQLWARLPGGKTVTAAGCREQHSTRDEPILEAEHPIIVITPPQPAVQC